MKIRFGITRIVGVLALATMGPGAAWTQTVGERVYKQAAPAVVTITAGDSIGTGFLVRDKRTFVTAAHVVSNGEVPTVKFGKGSYLSVRSMAVSKANDLAVLEVEDEVSAEPLALGDSEEIGPGAQVFAIGTALGALSHTLTDGMLSGIRRDGPTELIQVTSPFSPGMSGGPVLSKDAKVLGVISFSFTKGQNLNIAIAAKQVRSLLSEPTRATAHVTAELKQAAAAGLTADKPVEATPSGKASVDPVAKAQALADLISEVAWWVGAGTNDAFRQLYDSSSMEDWRLVYDSVESANNNLPLITIKGESIEVAISRQIELVCDDSECDRLGAQVLALARAMNDVASSTAKAIIHRHGGSVNNEQLTAHLERARDATIRVASLLDDLQETVYAIGGKQAITDRLSAKFYGRVGVLLGVQFDPVRADVAAVRWKYPHVDTRFRVGDVITDMRLTEAGAFVPIGNWKDVDRFLGGTKAGDELVVRVRGGREFVVKRV